MPPFGLLEAAAALRIRAGERALLVAEQLGLEQLGGNRRGVQRDERLGRARAVLVQRARDELLARARLAGDQHRDARARQTADGAEHLLHRRRAAEQLRNLGRLRRRLVAAPRGLRRRGARDPRPGRCRTASAGIRTRRLRRRDTALRRSECAVITMTGSVGMRVADLRAAGRGPTARHADVGDQHVRRVAAQRDRARAPRPRRRAAPCRRCAARARAPSGSKRRRRRARRAGRVIGGGGGVVHIRGIDAHVVSVGATGT